MLAVLPSFHARTPEVLTSRTQPGGNAGGLASIPHSHNKGIDPERKCWRSRVCFTPRMRRVSTCAGLKFRTRTQEVVTSRTQPGGNARSPP
eukprot:3899470-Pyramimonas_sp.AAC.1